MKLFKVLFVITATVLSSNCSSDSESDISTPPTTPPTTTITYTNTIQSIMSANCTSCHGTPTTNGASVSLNTYTNVKNAVINNQLIERISKAQGESGLMPFNGTRLPQTTIDKIISWKNDGYKE
ncbi:c-type cytochrome [Flavobacterium faecale]|uniref:c-type cytochrome n=1 Tax=Flavobacterium faecale TaxID=1355330 RepID=UPI003AAF044F